MSAATWHYRPQARAGVLCGVAGYVDAFGYIALGHVFAANMTGNTVLLAIAAVRGELPLATNYILTLAAFLIGAVLAATVKRAHGKAYLPLVLAAAAIVAIPATPVDRMAPLALLAVAMGLQGASLSVFGAISLHTVVVTGTLVRLAESVVDHLWRPAGRDSAPSGRAGLPLYATGWISYAIGAALGAAAIDEMSFPLVVPAVALLAVALDLALFRGSAP